MPRHPARSHTSHGSVPREDIDRVAELGPDTVRTSTTKLNLAQFERLLREGWEVVCLDSLITGDLENLAGCRGDDAFRFELADVTEHLSIASPVDWVLHLASHSAGN